MKNVITFKIGKEKIAIWQVFVLGFILFMFLICLFLGYGMMTTSSSTPDVKVSDMDTSVLSIITDYKRVPEELYNTPINDKMTYRDKYEKNYKKYISDNDGSLVIDNFEYNYYGNIDSQIYRVNINSNKWFLFNELNNKLDDSNIIYVVDSEMNFHRLVIASNTVVKNYTEEEGYVKYETEDFVFYYSESLDYFYGYRYIGGDSINDYYITVGGEGYGLPYESYKRLFVGIDNNIKVDESSNFAHTGVNLSGELKNFKLDDKLSLDLYTNILITNISNGTRNNRNKISFTYKDGISGVVSLSEVNKNVNVYTTNTSKNGFLQYTFGTKTIYLKYNIKEYPEFNYSLGGFNGVVLEIGSKTVLIQFDKTYTFESQEELEKELDTLLSPIIK